MRELSRETGLSRDYPGAAGFVLPIVIKTSGIGRETAIALGHTGCKVVLAARREAQLREVAEIVERSGSSALVVPTDMASPGDIQRLVNTTMEKWKRVDILVSNAGQYFQAPIAEMAEATIEQSLKVNFRGHVRIIRTVLPVMKAAGYGRIVLVSSLDAKKGVVGDGAYVAAKCAATGFCEVLRQELHGSGVSVTTVFPGRIDTPMIEHLDVPFLTPKFSSRMVARAIVRGISRPGPEIIVPSYVKPLLAAQALFPGIMDWLYRLVNVQGKRIVQRS